MKNIILSLALLFFFSFDLISQEQAPVWEKINIKGANAVYCISEASDGALFAGCNDGFYASKDEGKSWKRITPKMSNMGFKSVLFDNKGTMYTGTEKSGVMRSMEDYGKIKAINTGINTTDIQSIMLDKSGVKIAVGKKNVYCTVDDGKQWETIFTAGQLDNEVYASCLDSSNILYISTDKGILKYEPTSRYWNVVNYALRGNTYRALALAAGADGYLYAGSYSQIFRSIDNGENWSMVNSSIPGKGIAAIAISQNGSIFAGALDGGLVCSFDGGVHWHSITNGIGEAAPVSFVFNPDGKIYITATDKNMYRTKISMSFIYDIQSGVGDDGSPVVELRANPNPCNKNTNIIFNLKNKTDISLTLFNSPGQTIAVLIPGKEYEAGEFTIPYDFGELPSGAYFVTLKTPSGSKTVKLMNIK